MNPAFRRIVSYGGIALAAVIVLLGMAWGAITNNNLTGPGSAQAEAIPYFSSQPASVTHLTVEPPGRATVVVAATARVRDYHVISGDTLSSIAKSMYHNANAWPVIYWANTRIIKDPNIIYVSQNLVIPQLPLRIPAPPKTFRPVVYHAPVTYAPAKVYSAPVQNATTSAPVPAPVQGSSFQNCVKMAENGGSYAWGTGNGGGAYQFLYSTWVAVGGDPALYGNAGPAYQDQVFWMAVKLDGTSDWAPYDGC